MRCGRGTRLVTAVAIGAVLAGCEPAEPAGDSVVARVVSNGLEGVWTGEGEKWQVREVARIGEVDGPGPATFGDVADVDVDSSGTIFVLDGLEKEVRVFDSNGTHLRSFGSPGKGPGEFVGPSGLALHPNGTVWVADLPGGRYSVFDTAGSFQRVVAVQEALQAYPWKGGIDDGGRLFEMGLARRQDGRPEGILTVYRATEELEVVDTILLPWPEHDGIELPSGSTLPRPYSPRWRWYLAGSGHLWLAWTGEYTIRKVSPDGDTVLTIQKDYEPRRVPANARELLKTMGPRIPPTLLPAIVIPEYRPPLHALFVDDAGYLWVSTVAYEDELLKPGQPGQFDVFDPGGAYLGAVTAPFILSEGRRIAIRGDWIAGWTSDELGVDRVVVARIVRP